MMTEDEYNKKLKALEDAHTEAVEDLNREYAKSQRIYTIGDIIQDGPQIIRITKFGFTKMFGEVYPIYIGLKLKKDLTPMKSKEECHIHQTKENTHIKLLKKGESLKDFKV